MIFFWTAVALGIGAVVAFIAREKGRSPALWAFYGTVAPIVALPHVLIARSVNDDSWSPVRFGIPEPEHPCPHCGSVVRGEAIVCRHCHKPLYEARSVAPGADDGGADEPAAGSRKAHSDTGARNWLDETFSKFNETAGEAGADAAGDFRADPYERVTDPAPDEERLNIPREPIMAERVRREQVVSEPRAESAQPDDQAERAAAAKAEAERIEAARREAQQVAAKAEAERLAAAQAAAAKAEADRIAARRRDAERAEAERAEAQRRDAERAEAQRRDAERAEAQRREAERREAEQREAERREAERAAAARNAERREPHLAAARAATEAAELKVDPSERLTASLEAESRPAPKVDRGMRLIATSEPREGRGHHEERTRTPLSSDSRPPVPKKRDARKVAALAAAAAIVGFVVPWAAQYLPLDSDGRDRVTAVPPAALVPPTDAQRPGAAPSGGTETAEAKPDGGAGGTPAPSAEESQEIGTAKLAPPKLPSRSAAVAPPPANKTEAKPAAPKSADRKPAEPKPAEPKSAETKQAATKPAETKSADSTPAEPEPARTAAASPEASPTESRNETADPARAPAKLEPPKIEKPAPAPKASPKATAKAARKPQAEPARGQSQDEFMAMVDRALGGGAKSPDRISDSDPSVGSAGGPLVQVVQERLRDRGFDPGSIDGRTGPRTVQAIRAFQQSVGMKADGRIDMALMERLGIVGQQLHVFGR